MRPPRSTSPRRCCRRCRVVRPWRRHLLRRRPDSTQRLQGQGFMPKAAASLSLGQLALRFGCALRGDPRRQIGSVASLAGGAGSLGFLANPALRDALRDTRLGAVVTTPELAVQCPVDALLHNNPHATFARIAALLHPLPPP